jgi:hypothetical protein
VGKPICGLKSWRHADHRRNRVRDAPFGQSTSQQALPAIDWRFMTRCFFRGVFDGRLLAKREEDILLGSVGPNEKAALRRPISNYNPSGLGPAEASAAILSAGSHEAKAGETKDDHRPGRRFRHGLSDRNTRNNIATSAADGVQSKE